MYKKSLFLFFFLILLVSGFLFLEKTRNFFTDDKYEISYENKKTDSSKPESVIKHFALQKKDSSEAVKKEDKLEDKEEFRRMKLKLKGNFYIPLQPGDKRSEEVEKMLADKILLEIKMKKNTATRKEKIRYLKYQIKSARDKIAIAQYIMNRTADLSENNHKEYLSPEDIVQGREEIKRLGVLANFYESKLESMTE